MSIEAQSRDLHLEVERATYRVLAQADSLEEATPDILAAICNSLGWDFASLWTLSDPAHLTCIEHWATSGLDLERFIESTHTQTLEEGQGLPGRAWATGKPVWISDIGNDLSFPRAPIGVEIGLHAAVAFPIFVTGRFFGVMEFFCRPVHLPDLELLDLLDTIGQQIGDFIEWDRLEAELEFQKALLEYQGEASLDAIGVLSTDMRILYYNQRAIQMFDIDEEELAHGDAMPLINRLVSETTDPQAFSELADAILGDAEASHRVEAELRDGRYLDIWTAPVRSPEGKNYGRAIFARDISVQKEAELQLKRQEEWAGFIADATRLLTESMNIEVILERLAHITVPVLADWCAIHLVNSRGEPEQIAVAHVDPAKVALAREIQEKYPPDPAEGGGVQEAIKTRTPMLWPVITDDILVASARDEEHLRAIRELQMHSGMVVPIVARDRALGAITFVSAENRHTYTAEDLARAEELAGRAAFPIENAKLFAQSRQMAQTLQKSFLPPDLPDVPGVDVSARYFAAGEGELIGGDFYDAFRIDNRRWGIVLGDVSGKGLEAATVTALARHTMRGAALTSGRPSDALRILNAALLEQHQTDRFCTAVYAIVEPRFARVRVTVSSGGHPAPYVIRNDGTIEPIACGGTLLGFMDGIALRDEVVELEFGDKLFLYTDGVLDIRQRGGMFGTEGLEQLLYECSKRGTEGAAEHISQTIADLQQGKATDDIAFILLGVRSSVFNIRQSRGKTED